MSGKASRTDGHGAPSVGKMIDMPRKQVESCGRDDIKSCPERGKARSRAAFPCLTTEYIPTC